MVIKQDRSEVFAHLHQSMIYFFLAYLTAILVLSSLAYFISSGLSRPIRLLSRTSRQVESGDFSARSRITTSDEVGVLADAFNSMLQRIQARHEELTITNENLQKEITERKKIEDELIKAKEVAEEATKLKDKFVSLVSHDLKSPFISIKGFLDLILKDEEVPLNPKHNEMLERVQENSSRLLTMTDELLEIGRLQTGKIALHTSLINGRQVAALTLSHVSHQVYEKRIKLSNEVPEGMRLYADSQLLERSCSAWCPMPLNFARRGIELLSSFQQAKGRPSRSETRERELRTHLFQIFSLMKSRPPPPAPKGKMGQA